MSQTILDVRNLNVSYPLSTGNFLSRRKRTPVLKEISFSMKEGEILGLLGESGCGKTTLAHAILHLHTGYSGEITVYDHHPQMVFQDPYASLNPKKTIRFLLKEPLKLLCNVTGKEAENAVCSMIQRVGLTNEYLDRYPAELSGGQRQRICIARALISKPKLLIADEPVSALDVTIQAQIMDLLISLQKEMGISILFISHDLRLVYQICDRVMIMKEGSILENGTTDEVYFSPKEEYTKQLLNSAGVSE